MSRRGKEILKSNGLNIALASLVFFAVIEGFNLPFPHKYNLRDINYLVLLGLHYVPTVGTVLLTKKLVFDNLGIRKKSKRMRSLRRSKEKTKKKILLPLFTTVLLLILTQFAERNTNYRPHSFLMEKIGLVLNGVADQVYADGGLGLGGASNSVYGTEYTFEVVSTTITGIYTGELNSPEKISAYITTVFGSQSVTALRVAQCESGLNSTAIGDTGLTLRDPQTHELMGDSIGIFQIRTGGNSDGYIWNRARGQGTFSGAPTFPSVQAFREYLMVPENNINYAFNFYKEFGWSHWSCAK